MIGRYSRMHIGAHVVIAQPSETDRNPLHWFRITFAAVALAALEMFKCATAAVGRWRRVGSGRLG